MLNIHTMQTIQTSSHQHIIGHFGNESFQSITCTGTDNLTRTTKREQNTQNNTMQKVAIHTKKPRQDRQSLV